MKERTGQGEEGGGGDLQRKEQNEMNKISFFKRGEEDLPGLDRPPSPVFLPSQSSSASQLRVYNSRNLPHRQESYELHYK